LSAQRLLATANRLPAGRGNIIQPFGAANMMLDP
jgi:hypothetical protein